MRIPPRQVGLFLFLITLLLYLPVREAAFIGYDDPEYVVENSRVRAGLTWEGVKWAFTTLHFSNWHPLTWLSHMTDCELFGLAPGAHHVVNVLFHGVNAVLLFVLLRRWTSETTLSALVAALFAWHPLHVESVAWISERKDVLSLFFGLLSLLAYGRYAREGSRPYFWLAWLWMAVGLMAKPMLVTLPCVFVLLDYWPFGRVGGGPNGVVEWAGGTRLKLGKLLVEKWPFFVLTVASCWVTWVAQREAAALTLRQHSLDLRLGNALISYFLYLYKTFWPVELAVIYPLPQRLSGGLVVVSVVVLSSLTYVLWRWRREWPFAWVGWLWFGGTLVPVIGLVQVGNQSMADRYTYLPSIGLFLALVWGGRRWLGGWRWRWTVPALGVLACLVLTFRQIGYWRDGVTLFTRAIEVTRENGVAHINLSLALEEAGRKQEALVHVREGIRIFPNWPQPYNNLGNLLTDLGQYDEALAAYDQATRLDPSAELPHINRGVTLSKAGRYEQAIEPFETAARLAPEDPRPHALLARLHQRRGEGRLAVEQLRVAVRLDPWDAANLTRLARLLASDPDGAVRNGAEALQLAKRADALTGSSVPLVLDTLAMALAELGRFEAAVEVERLAIEAASASGETNAVEELRDRLKLFGARRPYREPIGGSLGEHR